MAHKAPPSSSPAQPSLFAPTPPPTLAAQAPAVQAFTDGACSGNPGPGGWGAVLKIGTKVVELSGAAAHTTNNRMELTAVLETCRHFNSPTLIHVTTDSQYVMKGATEWLAGWRRKGWRTSAGKPVENRDLWEHLAAAMAPHTLRWTWVRGHNGHPENERADALAVAASQTVRGKIAT